MITTLKTILTDAAERLQHQMTTYFPPLLAALTLLVAAYLTAVAARWVVYRIFKGIRMDRFLRQSGVALLMDPSGHLRATRLVAEAGYWCILLSGALVGLDAFGTTLSSRLSQSFVFLLPKVLEAGLILLGGMWLAQYLGRIVLVWAVNESLPSPRHIATAVRVLTGFVTVVVAADQLNFARDVFLAAFIIVAGGAVLAVSLAAGLGKLRIDRLFDRETESSRSIWSHL